METIVGYVNSLVFKSDKFFVLKVSTKDGHRVIRYTGSLPSPRISGKYKFIGISEVHRVYGEQLACSLFYPHEESSVIDRLSYFLPSQSSSFITTIGNKYGEKIIDWIRGSVPPDSDFMLDEVILSGLIKEYSSNCSRLELSQTWFRLGLAPSLFTRIWEKFGIRLQECLNRDPYDLVYEDPSSFPILDKYALANCIVPDHASRIKSMIVAGLYHACNNDGHMGMPSRDLLSYIKSSYAKLESLTPITNHEFLPDRFYYESVKQLLKAKYLEEENGFLYTKDNYFLEKETAKSIRNKLSRKPLKLKPLEAFIESYKNDTGIDLSEGQKKALELVKDGKLVLITGFPGTGKTSVIDALVNWCKESNLSVSLMSPTGIAAKRLSQVTKTPASTVHRALGCDQEGNWAFNSSNKFKSDVIIIDEMSMVDSRLFNRLMTSTDNSALLVLVGDPAQLPSVGSGDVLNQLAKCDKIPSVRLSKIYRQTGSSRITELAHEILASNVTSTETDMKSEVVFLPCSESQCLSTVVDLSGELKARDKHFQVLSPIYDSLLGVNNLNRSLRPVLNPEMSRGSKFKLSGEEVYEGDRVIVIKNDYDRSIYNGDTGKITSIDLASNSVRVKVFNWSDGSSPHYVDKYIDFNLGELDKYFKVAFATTVHRTQGNEYDYVVLPVTFKFGIMLYKNLIYTAITRAKKKVFIIGDMSAFMLAVKNERQAIRYSALAEMI